MSIIDNYHRRKDHIPPSASLMSTTALVMGSLTKEESWSDKLCESLTRTWGDLETLPEKSNKIMTDHIRPISSGSGQASESILKLLLFMTQQAFQSSTCQVQNTNFCNANQDQATSNKEYGTTPHGQEFKNNQNPNGISMRKDQKGITQSKGKSSSTVLFNSFQSETKGFGSKEGTNTNNRNTFFGQLRNCDPVSVKLGNCESLSKFNKSKYLRANTNANFIDSHANYRSANLGILPVLSWLLQVKNIELFLSQTHAIKSLISLLITVRYLVVNRLAQAIIFQLKKKSDNIKGEKEVSQKATVLSMELGGMANNIFFGQMGDWEEMPQRHEDHQGDDDEEMQQVPDFGEDLSDDDGSDDEDEFENTMNQGAEEEDEAAFHRVDAFPLVPQLDDGEVPQYQQSPDLFDAFANELMLDPEEFEAVLGQAQVHAPPQQDVPDFLYEGQVLYEQILLNTNAAHAG